MVTGLVGAHLVLRRGERRVLDGAGLALRRGEVLGLVGPNGAGKSTLLRLMAGLLAPDSGEIRLDGRPLAAWPAEERARQVAYLPQGATADWPAEVEWLVSLGRLPHRARWAAPRAADREAAASALRRCDVAHLRGRSFATLSGGEKARVMLARALAAQAPYLLADEPTAALDPGHQLLAMETLRAEARRGVGVLVTLHDLTLAGRFCDRIAALAEGRVLADAPPGEALRPEILAAANGIATATVTEGGESAVVPWRRLAP